MLIYWYYDKCDFRDIIKLEIIVPNVILTQQYVTNLNRLIYFLQNAILRRLKMEKKFF